MPARFHYAHTPGRCSYQPCGRPIPNNHYLCQLHYARFHDGQIVECEGGCGYFLPPGYSYCAKCGADDDAEGPVWPPQGPTAAGNGRNGGGQSAPQPAPEPNAHRTDHDAEAPHYWAYLLRLQPEHDDGVQTVELYASQTPELWCRMMDHVDGRCTSTRGRRPALVWFAQADTWEAAVEAAVELNRLLVVNRPAVLRRIAEFQQAVALVSQYPDSTVDDIDGAVDD